MERKKLCAECGNDVFIFGSNSSFVQKKYCLPCLKKRKSECDKRYREKMYETLKEKKKVYYYTGGKEKKCKECKKSFFNSNKLMKFCSRNCFHKDAKVSRAGKGNPVWKNAKHPQTYNKLYFDNMDKTKGLLPDEIGCEVCSVMTGTIFDRHHIIFKSEKYNHKELNNPRNIIQVCRGCHLRFHSKSLKREKYIKERNLEELFGCKLK